MKYAVFILFISLTSFRLAGQAPLAYSGTVKVDSVTHSELYQRAKNWFVASFEKWNEVLRKDDKRKGELIGKARMRYNPSADMQTFQQAIQKDVIWYTIKISLMEGAYKYELGSFYYISGSSGNKDLVRTSYARPNTRDVFFADMTSQINSNVTLILASLNAAMLDL